ncbi:MAG: tetratricopeptide repeat protein [Gemmatirosa sp.]|nr:tetratricopeptide repeat protein [Gemmatirosa sp.]
MADGALCERLDGPRAAEARPTAQQLARAGGTRGAFLDACLTFGDGKFGDAADRFERVVKADDANAVAHFWLGRAYGAQAQRANVFKQASLARKTKGEFERAVQLDPEYLDAREGLMEYYLQAPDIMGGSKDKARGQIAEIRRRDGYRGGMLAATVALREKDAPGALREYEQLTTQFPDSAAPWVQLAYTELQQKRWDDAFAAIERMQKAMPGSMVPQYALGRAAAESGQQLDRGEQVLKRYLAYTPKLNDPPIANTHWRLGTIYERRGQTDAARAEYQAALQLDPRLTGARDALAKLK